MAELSLVLGGARSGKSAFAERLATGHGQRLLYVATAEALDPEMVERARKHQARRGPNWSTIEEPIDPVRVLRETLTAWDAVLLDCLSIWVSNLLLADPSLNTESPHAALQAALEEQVLQRIQQLITWQSETGQPLIVVSGEVGLGVVPPYPLGRLYRDVLGLANQEMAAAAATVYFVMAGLGIDLKALQP